MRASHHPAPSLLALGLKINSLSLLQQLERGSPKLKVKDFAFARQDVVADTEPSHGVEVAVDHCIRDHVTHVREFANAGFNGVQGVMPPSSLVLLVLGKVLRYAGVEIPADIIEARLFGESFDFSQAALLKEVETGHNVGHLHPGVIDVVLHLDHVAHRAHHPHERVAQYRISQMSNMRGFIGVDVGVFNDHLAGVRLGTLRSSVGQQFAAVSSAVQPDIHIALPGDFHGADAGERGNRRGKLVGDSSRTFTERLCEREGSKAQFTERGVGGFAQSDASIEPVASRQMRGHEGLKLLLDSEKHENTKYSAGCSM